MKELPKHVRKDIYKEFLFKDFIYLFKHHFKIIKDDSLGRKKVFYTWDDAGY